MKRLFFGVVFAVVVHCSLFANMGPAGFSQFRNTYFVETGTFGGDSVVKALKVGFKEVRTIEANSNHVNQCKQRFAGYRNVKIWHGDSAEILFDVIKDIREPITFWLDAHIYPPLNHVRNCPLIQELEQIRAHPIKTHTILIDDMHCANTQAFDYLTKEDLIKKILEINPSYQISYVDGGDQGEYKNNVMVAIVR